MNYSINTAAANTIRFIALILLVTIAGLLTFNWISGQPFYINGQPYGYHAKAFDDLNSKLESTRASCSTQLTESTKLISAQQQELAQWHERDQHRQAQIKSTWFPIADVEFDSSSLRVWRNPESELTLALESINRSGDELVLKTNLPAPGNKIRLQERENSWTFPMNKWNYRVTLVSAAYGVAIVRIERQSKQWCTKIWTNYKNVVLMYFPEFSQINESPTSILNS